MLYGITLPNKSESKMADTALNDNASEIYKLKLIEENATQLRQIILHNVRVVAKDQDRD